MLGIDADVAVVGVGTMGSMAAWRLARAGASVLGFEQFSPGHDRSAAGGESRMFRTAYHEGSEYTPVLLRSLDLWRELERASGRDLLNLCGGLSIGPRHTGLVADVIDSATRSGLPYDLLDAAAMTDRFPQHRLLPGEVGVFDASSGVIRPEFAVVSAAGQAEALGARILTSCAVEAIVPDRGSVTVHADGRQWRVGQVLITTGPWLQRLAPSVAASLTVKRLVMTWYLARDQAEFAPNRFPVFIRHSGNVHIFGVPSLDGGSVKISAVGDYGDVRDPDRLDERARFDELRDVTDAVRDLLPGLVPSPVRAGTYMDAFTPDGHAIIGRPRAVGNVLIMGGFSGHGFKLSPALGQAAADLLLTGATDIAIGHLDAGRYRELIQ
jgi:sarcosine oxidase